MNKINYESYPITAPTVKAYSVLGIAAVSGDSKDENTWQIQIRTRDGGVFPGGKFRLRMHQLDPDLQDSARKLFLEQGDAKFLS